MAEGRGKAQAEHCERRVRKQQRIVCGRTGRSRWYLVRSFRSGDEVLVTAGELIPGDGEVIEGVASVDESAITGESAPVIRESGVTVPP